MDDVGFHLSQRKWIVRISELEKIMSNLQMFGEIFHYSKDTFIFICRLYMVYMVRYYILFPRRKGEVAEDGHQDSGMPCTVV